MEKKFQVIIEETISEVFTVCAENSEDALKSAMGKYRSGEYVLAPGNLTSGKLAVVSAENEETEWIEI